MEPADEAFVFRAWLEGYWPNSGAALVMSKSDWLPRWHAVIARILRDRNCGSIVAHVQDAPSSLLGFAVSGHGCLHWCYVKQAFRSLGIATAMLHKFNFNEQVASLWSPKLEEHGWRYDPRMLRGGYGA
jgi:GNAT superfamily N-acetyltransferase